MINKINPLYLLSFLITLLLISVIEQNKIKTEFNKTLQDTKEFNKSVNEYIHLKSLWLNEKNKKEELKSILQLDPNIQYKKYKRKYKLTFNSQDKILQEKFINSVLNANLIIEKINIKENITIFEIEDK